MRNYIKFDYSVWLDLAKKALGLRLRQRLCCLKYNKHVCEVTVTCVSIKPDHSLSLTLTECCESLSPTKKKQDRCHNTGSCDAGLDILAERKTGRYVQYQLLIYFNSLNVSISSFC